MTARSATTRVHPLASASFATHRGVVAAALSILLLLAPLTALAEGDGSRPLGAAPRAVHESAALPAPESAAAVSPGSLLRTVLSLAVVLGIAVALAAAARRIGAVAGRGTLMSAMGPGGPSPSGVLEVLGRYPLNRQQTLVVLRFDRRVLLLSQSRSARAGCTLATLCEIDDMEAVASVLLKTRDDESAASADRFSDLINRFDPRPDGVTVVSAAIEPASDRSIHESAEGDRAELLDERVLPFPRQGQPQDAVGSLRQRLESLRRDQADFGGSLR